MKIETLHRGETLVKEIWDLCDITIKPNNQEY